MSNKKVSTPPSPCWFTENDKSYQGTDFDDERESRMMRGYSKDVSLNEAVKQFNEEMLCPDPHQPFPLLTEEEVIKAAASGIVADDPDDADLTKRNLNLRRVLDEKVLAKGLLLRELSTDATGYDDIRETPTPGVKKQFVYLYTGLDDNDMLCCVVDRKQRLLIRELTHHSEPK